MAMSARQFAAAHDRLLEPPDDDDFDGTDECDLPTEEGWQAEQWRQKQEDSG